MAFLLNFWVRLLGKILRINHKLDREFQSIAISKFKGMGSILQATPMLQMIRETHPNAKIIFVSTESNRGILSKIEWIDEIITVNDKSFWKFVGSNIRSLWKLMRIRPTIYFDLEIYSDYSTLFTLYSLSINRVGFYLRSSSYRMGIYTHMVFFNPRVPISKVYLQMARLICPNAEEGKIYRLAGQGLMRQRPYVLINPNASDLRLERRWPKERFTELIRGILNAHPEMDVVLIGAKNERGYTEEVAHDIKSDRLINLAARTNLEELINLISRAQLMITNDTGPMHIAFSTKVNVICLFGPCAPDQYGISDRAHIIYKKPYCSPCVHDFEIPPCKGNNICMKLITVDEVMEKFETLLANPDLIDESASDGYVFTVNNEITGIVNR